MNGWEITQLALAEGACQKPQEFLPLVERVHALRPRTVVEIGTMRGGTLAAWCAAAAGDGLIVSVDLPGGEFGGGYSEADVPRFQGFTHGVQRLELVQADSHDPATVSVLRRTLGDRQVDFLFIDGDHTYEGVKADFELYAPFVRPGGLVAFHDVLPHPDVPVCQVARFWNELKHDFAHQEFLFPADDRGWGQWGGIGLLEIPA